MASKFICPKCGGPIIEGKDIVRCQSCDASYPIDDGLHIFLARDSSHGELSKQEMTKLISSARAHGWRDALERSLPTGKEFVRQLVEDSRRSRSIEQLSGVGGRVLDFGCGYGGVSLALADMFDEVVSLDGSNERIAFLNIVRQQEGIGNITAVCHSDVENLPFSEGYFDAVVMIGVFEYLPQSIPNLSIANAHNRSLQSIRRILRPGGYLLIQTKNRFGWQFLLGAADNSGLRFAPVLPTRLVDILLRVSGRGPYRIVNYSFSGYRRMIQRAGFSTPEISWPIPAYQLPDYVINLGKNMVRQLREIRPGYHSPTKRFALHGLAALGVLPYVAPYFCVVARKPG